MDERPTAPLPSRADVVVVGASIAGCTAAMFLGRLGLNVLLLERAGSASAYKKVCTHYIQPSAIPTLKRLELCEALEAAGAVRSVLDLWVPWGWIRWDISEGHGYNLRREKLDPLLRQAAAATPGVRLVSGAAVEGLVREGGRITGVVAGGATVKARLVVGADGRHGKTSAFAEIPTESRPHNRFSYLAYFRNPRAGADGTRLRTWLLEPDFVYDAPTDDGLTCLSVQIHKDQLPTWRADPEAALRARVRDLPDGDHLRDLQRVSDVHGMVDMTNQRRTAAIPGLALVGDAALAADPLFGVGCGWAFQSAEWLAEAVGPALGGEDRAVDEALMRYRDRHSAELLPHHRVMCSLSTGRPLRWPERLLYKAAARDRRIGEIVHRLTAREITPAAVMKPGVLARAVWAATLGG